MSEFDRHDPAEESEAGRPQRRQPGRPHSGKGRFDDRRRSGRESGGRDRQSGDRPHRFRDGAAGRGRTPSGAGRGKDQHRRDRGERFRQENRGRRFDRTGHGDRHRPDARRRGGEPRARTEEGAAHDRFEAPELDENIQFSDLDAEARRELRSLPKGVADHVGRHLVAAQTLLDEDPETAWAHASFAKKKAPRLPLVREAAGLTAYRAGKWSEAATELRAVRRMTRSDLHVAVIADVERALGRPERALDIAKETDISRLPKEVEVELRIVAAGARRDLGQLDAAVITLHGDDLDPKRHAPWSARLFYAYADNLAAAGRPEEALRWFLYAADADLEEETDAAARAVELADD